MGFGHGINKNGDWWSLWMLLKRCLCLPLVHSFLKRPGKDKKKKKKKAGHWPGWETGPDPEPAP